MKRFAPPFRESVFRMAGFVFLASLLTSLAFGTGVTVRLVAEGGDGGRWTRAVSEEWAKKTGNALPDLSQGVSRAELPPAVEHL